MFLPLDLGYHVLDVVIGIIIGIPVTIYAIEPLLEKRRVSSGMPLVRSAVEFELWEPLDKVAKRALAVAKSQELTIPKEQLQLAAKSVDDFVVKYGSRVPNSVVNGLIIVKQAFTLMNEIQTIFNEKPEYGRTSPTLPASFARMLACGVYQLFDQFVALRLASSVDVECPTCGQNLKTSFSGRLYCPNCQSSSGYLEIFLSTSQ